MRTPRPIGRPGRRRTVKIALAVVAVTSLFASAGTAALLLGRETAGNHATREAGNEAAGKAPGNDASTGAAGDPSADAGPAAPSETSSSDAEDSAGPEPRPSAGADKTAPDEGRPPAPAQGQEAAAATETVTAFLQAWVDPTVGQSDWLERMRPHAATELMSGLALTDVRLLAPDGVYAVTLVRLERLPDLGAQATATARLRSGTELEVSAQQQASGTWAVTAFAPTTAPAQGTAALSDTDPRRGGTA